MDTYQFEALGDERFQQLCQALLASIHPNVVCYPVGMPDGGRDALLRSDSSSGAAPVVFQVKYVKDPMSRDSRDLVESVAKSEKHKVDALKKRGVKTYYLMTNALGTSHLDHGSMDKVNEELSSELGIVAHCWWRDDLARRIDGKPSIKWSFLELIRGGDILHALIDRVSGAEDPRIKVIKSYLALQRVKESQLKFKQIELQKGILELFVDLPTRLSARPGEDKAQYETRWAEYVQRAQPDRPHDYRYYGGERQVGGMRIMSQDWFSEKFNRLVVEGAPGQGKSTVTQFLCQVHRLILLGEEADLKKIPSEFVPAEVRVPFRVDLRDYATWLAGRNPFSEDYSSPLQPKASPVLEAFIAAQVSRHTGTNFNVEDLRFIGEKSKFLIVLDGFDEVADIDIRNKMVQEVGDAGIRLAQVTMSCQIIVTSRPAVFANSPGFSRKEWDHLEILPLTRPYIDSYAKKWLEARGLDPRERLEISHALEEKLQHEHVRDLARNPMQLAILLTLISVQGASLPNKRTALYDNYIEIFFNRETEKSPVVRDHRDLLIHIHRYLAWSLQLESEANGAGNISDAKLRSVVRDYLERHGHSTEIVDKLFTGMMERVVALVSRVQGTYEFEVQPLREYFAARYLYDTAPYAQAGVECKGSKPDRFDAIAKSFYWHNVTRFYAGCYTTGELASLIDGLDQIAGDNILSKTAYVAQLGVELLSDYVFSTQPKLAERLSRQLTNSPSFPVYALVLSAESSAGGRVPEGPARQTLIGAAINCLCESRSMDAIIAYAKILTENSEAGNEKVVHDLLFGVADKVDILGISGMLGIYDEGSLADLQRFESLNPSRYARMAIANGRPDLVGNSPEVYEEVLEYFVDTGLGYFHDIEESDSITNEVRRIIKASGLFSSFRYRDVLRGRQADTLAIDLFFNSLNPFKEIPSVDWKGRDWTEFDEAVLGLATLSAAEFLEDHRTISSVIEAIRKVLGNRSSFNQAAIIYAAISSAESASELDLFDDSVPLAARSLSAKCGPKSQEYWTRQLLGTHDAPESIRTFVLACVLKWMPLSAIIKNSKDLSDLAGGISSDGWVGVSGALNKYLGSVGLKKQENLLTRDFPEILGPRVCVGILSRVNASSAQRLWRRFLANYSGGDSEIAEFVTHRWIYNAEENSKIWPEAVERARELYGYGGHSFHYIESSSNVRTSMPASLAESICSNPQKYPVSLVVRAAASLNAEVGKMARPVAIIAKEGQWLAEE
ncbi:NACHT domain-containing protein [Xanthomonas translucens]|uniref:NACHT domain-containing protein n=1 Tax=Xanthomonas campestris pv. translucens TaxID=343 RepID=UPI000AA7F30D|nr:hypothetical protein [Xanthomonas translucens]QEO27842.1 hypothetical protein F0H32_18160 [Xanthomonas translucens pv. undulosa]UJB14792.1 hypothetical protein LTC53_17930 [Xanthomonas translucens pv. undulosa]